MAIPLGVRGALTIGRLSAAAFDRISTASRSDGLRVEGILASCSWMPASPCARRLSSARVAWCSTWPAQQATSGKSATRRRNSSW
ncbi:hypothetical protein [Nonomuraea rubra]|uniref:hypothetical protein n=1 Tax=Nonomuraea rubra TaxID=46180 RepID=UPI0031EF2C6C